MKVNIIKEKKEVHVRIEHPLCNNVKSSGARYYPHQVKIGAPKVIKMLKDEGIEVGSVLQNAVLDNRSEDSRTATWVFALKHDGRPTSATKKAPRRRQRSKTTKKTETEV